MKKTICLLLVLALTLSSALLFGSCDNNDDVIDTTDTQEETTVPEATTESEATSEPEVTTELEDTTEPASEIPKGYKLYNTGEVCFVYPESWQLSEGSVLTVMDAATGESMNVVFENANEMYSTMTLESYDELLRPVYEAMGYTIVDVQIGRATNEKGIEFIIFDQTFLIKGVEIKMYQAIKTFGERTYTFSFARADGEVFDTMFNSICEAE